MVKKQLKAVYESTTIEAFRQQAARNGESLAEYVHDCCAANLDDDLRNEVAERRPPGRPTKNTTTTSEEN